MAWLLGGAGVEYDGIACNDRCFLVFYSCNDGSFRAFIVWCIFGSISFSLAPALVASKLSGSAWGRGGTSGRR